MTGGPLLVTRRYALIEEVCAVVEARWERSARGALLPDLPALLVIGGVIRYLSLALGRGPVKWEREARDLESWLDGYRVPARERRWTSMEPTPAVLAAATGRGPRVKAARLLPARGEAISAAAADAAEREQILHATAEVRQPKGLCTRRAVAEIAARAGVSREGFYRQFDSKQAALDAAVTLLFEEAMAAMGGRLLRRRHAVAGADLGELESADGGPGQRSGASRTSLSSTRSRPTRASARRADELFLGFTIFLTEGAELARDHEPPRIASRAITAAMIELGASCAAAGAVRRSVRVSFRSA